MASAGSGLAVGRWGESCLPEGDAQWRCGSNAVRRQSGLSTFIMAQSHYVRTSATRYVVTIAPRWKHLWRQHGITGGTLSRILAGIWFADFLADGEPYSFTAFSAWGNGWCNLEMYSMHSNLPAWLGFLHGGVVVLWVHVCHYSLYNGSVRAQVPRASLPQYCGRNKRTCMVGKQNLVKPKSLERELEWASNMATAAVCIVNSGNETISWTIIDRHVDRDKEHYNISTTHRWTFSLK